MCVCISEILWLLSDRCIVGAGEKGVEKYWILAMKGRWKILNSFFFFPFLVSSFRCREETPHPQHHCHNKQDDWEPLRQQLPRQPASQSTICVAAVCCLKLIRSSGPSQKMMTMMLMMCSSLVLLGLIGVGASSSGSSSSSPRMKLSYKGDETGSYLVYIFMSAYMCLDLNVSFFVCSPDLQQFNGVKRFDLERSCCFGALLLDEERGRLFVGARNFLLSLSLDNISKQEQKVEHTPYSPSFHLLLQFLHPWCKSERKHLPFCLSLIV